MTIPVRRLEATRIDVNINILYLGGEGVFRAYSYKRDGG